MAIENTQSRRGFDFIRDHRALNQAPLNQIEKVKTHKNTHSLYSKNNKKTNFGFFFFLLFLEINTNIG